MHTFVFYGSRVVQPGSSSRARFVADTGGEKEQADLPAVSENVVALAVELFTRPPMKAWGAVRKRACSAPSQCAIADFLLDLRGFSGL